jgi:hypothetical protein
MPDKLNLYEMHNVRQAGAATSAAAPAIIRETRPATTGRVLRKKLPLPSVKLFADDPLFEDLPEFELGQISEAAIAKLDELAEIEREVFQAAKEGDRTDRRCKNRGNKGHNLGISFVGGGRHSSIKKGYSGSLHCAGFIKKRPELRKRILECFQVILQSAFGDRPWFQRLCSLADALNKEEALKSGQRRTVPGLPITGIWLGRNPVEGVVHVDEDVVSVSFVLTTRQYKGASLCVLSRKGELVDHLLCPGEILAGTWSNDAHCNIRVDESEGRISWTLYWDMRAFSERYKCISTSDY